MANKITFPMYVEIELGEQGLAQAILSQAQENLGVPMTAQDANALLDALDELLYADVESGCTEVLAITRHKDGSYAAGLHDSSLMPAIKVIRESGQMLSAKQGLDILEAAFGRLQRDQDAARERVRG